MNKHPYYRRALIYFMLPIALFALAVILSAYTTPMDQSTRTFHVYNTIMGASIIFSFLFIVPFWIFAVKYWLVRPYAPQELPPPDSVDHTCNVAFTTNRFNRLFMYNILMRHGTLTWNHANKQITLTRQLADRSETIFSVPYSQVQKMTDTFNMITIKVAGKSYACTPSNALINTMEVTNLTLGASQGGAIELGTVQFIQAGMPELMRRLSQAGVVTVGVEITKSIEYGVVSGFVILYACAILIAVFIVK